VDGKKIFIYGTSWWDVKKKRKKLSKNNKIIFISPILDTKNSTSLLLFQIQKFLKESGKIWL
jgi:hypothetical protein